VKSIIEVAVPLDDPAVDQSVLLHQKKRLLSKFWAYHVGTNGQAVPEKVEAAYDKTIEWLNDVAGGRKTLGHSPAPTTSFPVEIVDIDPNSKRTTRDNLKHFC
jgi:hypothetical protein